MVLADVQLHSEIQGERDEKIRVDSRPPDRPCVSVLNLHDAALYYKGSMQDRSFDFPIAPE